MQKGDTYTIQDIPGFLKVKLEVKYLESCENCKIWLNRQGLLIGGMTPLSEIARAALTLKSIFSCLYFEFKSNMNSNE